MEKVSRDMNAYFSLGTEKYWLCRKAINFIHGHVKDASACYPNPNRMPPLGMFKQFLLTP